jgi:ParB family chromosome partitioning protein
MKPAAASRTTWVIPLESIDAPQLDARLTRDPEKLEELARDILRRGLIEPIKVVRVGDRFEVVDGFRRFLASKSAGLVEIECFVFDTKTDALEGVKYAANIFREEMSPADEAKMFHELLTHECEHDIERLAALTGKRITYLDNRLALLNGDELVFEALKDRTITIGVAQELNRLPAEDYRRHYLHHAVKTGATVGVVRSWVSDWIAMYSDRGEPAAAAPAASSGAMAPAYDPNTCYVCRKSDARFIPQQLNVHEHCRLATLDPLLNTYHGTDTL